MELDKVKQNS